MNNEMIDLLYRAYLLIGVLFLLATIICVILETAIYPEKIVEEKIVEMFGDNIRGISFLVFLMTVIMLCILAWPYFMYDIYADKNKRRRV